jgi:hypothetical protein
MCQRFNPELNRLTGHRFMISKGSEVELALLFAFHDPLTSKLPK